MMQDLKNIIIKCNRRFFIHVYTNLISGGRRRRDRMVVGFTTTYAISAYHH